MAPRRSPDSSSTDSQLSEPKTSLTTKDDSTFDFFRLPRELRDQIYFDSLAYKRKYPDQSGARVRGRRVADPNFLLISKQFKSEYLERAEQHTALIIVDRPEYHGDNITLPSEIAYARHLEVHIAIACDAPDHVGNQCRVTKEVRMHHRWLSNLCTKMRHLQSVQVDMVIDPHQYINECEAKLMEMQYKLSNVLELSSLRLFYCDYAGRDFGWNFGKSRKLAWEWDAEDRSLHRVASSSVKGEICEADGKGGEENDSA
ncbi:hypothetical protein LTR78_004328 [Recurvomyces mirabilis]|uniref:Uncharacterized protein n=1 Tax=Recurvomyces mirabilis TaxID=574656 RepID=A0AAE1C2M6_9PEZI|nr:hypothetical protein LTR78_004328 [Recurvomyces mirabilis]KAK5156007.1 hypothetical protein LTS14_005573 [Recurvomyces mirabilis]